SKDGKLADRDAGQLLHYPTFTIGQGGLQGSLPFLLNQRRPDPDTLASIRSVWFQHQRFPFASGVVKQVPRSAIGKDSLPISEKSRPKDVPSKNLPLLGCEVSLGVLWIGEDLPAAFLVQLRGDGRDNAVLLKQGPHRPDVHALACQVEQIANRIVAVSKIHAGTLIENLAVRQRQLARVGVQQAHAVTVAVEPGQFLLLVRPATCILWLDKEQVFNRPPEGLGVVLNFLHQEVANVRSNFQAQSFVALTQLRQDEVCQETFGRGDEVQAADAAQVRLHKAQRVLPHRADEVHHGVESAEHRIVLALARSPAIPEPFFFSRGQAQDLAHAEVLKIQLR